MKENKGITLIALVITIIVLLILAAVSIATLTGENGILSQANKAKNKTEQAHEKEQIQLAYVAVKSKKMETGDNTKISAEDLNDEFTNDGIEAQATDGEEGKIKVTFSKTGNEYEIDENGEVGEKIPLIKATSIKVEDLTIEAGVKTKQLNVTTTPSEITEKLIYTSKKEEIVTVDSEGKVTARGEGTTEIEIKGEKSNITETCNVTVEFGVGVKALTKNQTYANNGTAIIPVGFCIVPGCNNVEEGLVISDDDEDTEVNKDSIIAKGNQFVWVPVNYDDNIVGKDFKSVFQREAGYSEETPQTYGFASDTAIDEKYYEPNEESIDTMYASADTLKEVKAMYESVKVNKGFYIGRYEAGITEEDTSKTGIRGDMVCKKGQKVYGKIGWSASNDMTIETGGAVELARGFATPDKYPTVKSTLCYGVQWDAVMKWMSGIDNSNAQGKSYVQNSTGMGWYSDNSSKQLKDTGIGENNKVKNIYDMAGNVWEWEMETSFKAARVLRGGCSYNNGYNNPVSYRGADLPGTPNDEYGFRPTLYLL